jgi:hypothetical protein
VSEEEEARQWAREMGAWMRAADAWLDADPRRRARLEAWESEFVCGDEWRFGTSDWPGWLEEGGPGRPPWRLNR